MNCWEFKKCDKKESCPAYPSNGRKCAIVLGTLLNNEKQNSYVDKLMSCPKCDYFRSGFHVDTVD